MQTTGQSVFVEIIYNLLIAVALITIYVITDYLCVPLKNILSDVLICPAYISHTR